MTSDGVSMNDLFKILAALGVAGATFMILYL